MSLSKDKSSIRPTKSDSNEIQNNEFIYFTLVNLCFMVEFYSPLT